MKSQLKMLAIGATCAALVTFKSFPAVAEPLSIMPTAAAVAPVAKSGIEQVRYRNGGRYRGGNYRRGGRGGGIGVGIIGGIIRSEAARSEHRGSHGDQWDRCARTYRSCDQSSGLYKGYDGVRRTSP